jgi:GTPase involved in cell partitioning and DNA repair
MSSIPASTDAGVGEEMVLISKAELEELRTLKEELPTIIENEIKCKDKERLKALAARAKENPQLRYEINSRWYNKNKDEINAKRREAYKKRKEAQQPSDRDTVCIAKSPGIK